MTVLSAFAPKIAPAPGVVLRVSILPQQVVAADKFGASSDRTTSCCGYPTRVYDQPLQTPPLPATPGLMGSW
jgi:hypothetical protein